MKVPRFRPQKPPYTIKVTPFPFVTGSTQSGTHFSLWYQKIHMCLESWTRSTEHSLLHMTPSRSSIVQFRHAIALATHSFGCSWVSFAPLVANHFRTPASCSTLLMVWIETCRAHFTLTSFRLQSWCLHAWCKIVQWSRLISLLGRPEWGKLLIIPPLSRVRARKFRTINQGRPTNLATISIFWKTQKKAIIILCSLSIISWQLIFVLLTGLESIMAGRFSGLGEFTIIHSSDIVIWATY